MSTTQVPQLDVSQPQCVPVRPSSSRRKWTSSRRGSTSRVCSSPLTETVIRNSRLLSRAAGRRAIYRGAAQSTGGWAAQQGPAERPAMPPPSVATRPNSLPLHQDGVRVKPAPGSCRQRAVPVGCAHGHDAIAPARSSRAAAAGGARARILDACPTSSPGAASGRSASTRSSALRRGADDAVPALPLQGRARAGVPRAPRAAWTRDWLQAEVERRGAEPAERLLAIFDVFDTGSGATTSRAARSSTCCSRPPTPATAVRGERRGTGRIRASSRTWRAGRRPRRRALRAQVAHPHEGLDRRGRRGRPGRGPPRAGRRAPAAAGGVAGGAGPLRRCCSRERPIGLDATAVLVERVVHRLDLDDPGVDAGALEQPDEVLVVGLEVLV